MENRIIEYLKDLASLNCGHEQIAWYTQQVKDARPVQCVRMRDVFTREQLQFIFKNTGYKAEIKMCYKNAAELVECIEWMAVHYDSDIPDIKYVEGFLDSLFPVEHAFVKVGDKYIDPTFERALHLDVRNMPYVSCIELDRETMEQYQTETGYYGGLYMYDYMRKNRPEMAERMRARNPHNR